MGSGESLIRTFMATAIARKTWKRAMGMDAGVSIAEIRWGFG